MIVPGRSTLVRSLFLSSCCSSDTKPRNVGFELDKKEMARISSLAESCSIILNVLKLQLVGLPCEGCLATVEYFFLRERSDAFIQMQ
jgi:hypothetical protein